MVAVVKTSHRQKFKDAKASKARRRQVAALCYRLDDNEGLQVLLITSRRSGRWVIPKGWPMRGITPQQSAAQEAWEEAGVIGQASGRDLGQYSYNKLGLNGTFRKCKVTVYPLAVTKTKARYPEAGQRELLWCSPKDAAKRVNEPKLKRILKALTKQALAN